MRKSGNMLMPHVQYNRLLTQKPDDESARLELANLYFRAKTITFWVKCAATLKDYFKHQKNPPKDIRAMYMEALYNSKQYKDALPVAMEFQKLEPNSKLAARIIAYGLIVEKQYAQAVEAYRKLATLDTMEFDDYQRLGFAYEQIKKDTLAAITYEQVLLVDTTQTDLVKANLYGRIGSIWMRLKNWQRAAENFEKRIQLDSTAVGASINYASCMIQLEQYEKASSALKKAIIKNPKYPPAYVNLGFCYFQMKDYDAGQKEFETAIKVIDTMETKYSIELADSYRMIALAIMMEKKTTEESSKKKWEDAIVILKKSIKYKEDVAQTHLLLGQCYQNLNKIDDAIKEYKRVLKLDPKNKDAQKYLDDLLKLKQLSD